MVVVVAKVYTKKFRALEFAVCREVAERVV